MCLAAPGSGAPKALVQLAHGMAEHKGRYLPFMEYLAEHGYAVLVNDHRGHGAILATWATSTKAARRPWWRTCTS